MTQLEQQDLQWVLRRCPKAVLQLLKKFPGASFVAGGFVRSVIANEPVNDIDLFAPNNAAAAAYAESIAAKTGMRVSASDNAYTVYDRSKVSMTVQVIHRWVYDSPTQLMDSFDFTIAMAGFWFAEAKPQRVVVEPENDGYDLGVNTYLAEPAKWSSICHPSFYADLAAKRLRYTSPQRNEDAGGSFLRMLKFYKRGYRIPLDSAGAVVARLVRDVRWYSQPEADVAKVVTGLLHEVDPNIDPNHIAHLASLSDKDLEAAIEDQP